MSTSPVVILSNSFSNLENGEFPSAEPLTVTLLQPSMQPLTLPTAHKTKPNHSEEFPKELTAVPTPAIKKAGPKPNSRSTEGATRRRSTRVSITPVRFQPEVKVKKHFSTPFTGPEGGSPATLQNTPTAQGIMEMETRFTATPVLKGAVVSNGKPAKKITTPVAVKDIADGVVPRGGPLGPKGVGKEVSSAKESIRRDSIRAIPPKEIRGRLPLGAEMQDTSTRDSVEEDIVGAGSPKRNHKKTKTAHFVEDATIKISPLKNGSGMSLRNTRKSTTSAKEIAEEEIAKSPPPKISHLKKKSSSVEETTKRDVASNQLDKDAINSRKRSASEEPYTGNRFHKKSKPEGRKYLVPAPTARKTRSQNALASEFVGSPMGSPASETPVLETPILKIRIPKSKILQLTVPKIPALDPPRLSNMNFRLPLRDMIKSATLHYSTLPTNLSDRRAVASLYRTFFAGDIYRKHLGALGLEGDDADVRAAMKQVWEIVSNGERDDEVVWRMFAATWSY